MSFLGKIFGRVVFALLCLTISIEAGDCISFRQTTKYIGPFNLSQHIQNTDYIIGSIYFARSSNSAIGVIYRFMPKILDNAIISAFSENVLRNNQQISGSVNDFFAQKLYMFSKDSADGNYLLDGL